MNITEIYLKEIFENVYISLKAVNKSLRLRSGLEVVKKDDFQFSLSVLNCSYEEAQLLWVKEEAEIFLGFYSKKLTKSSRKVQKVFTVSNFTKVMIMFNNIFSQAKQQKELDKKMHHFIANPCFILLVYSTILKNKALRLASTQVKKITFDGVIKIAQKLRLGKYHSSSVKFDNSQNSPKDQIVQKIVHIFIFFIINTSCDFRPKNVSHSTLKLISRTGDSTVWFIRLNLLKALKQNHYKLLIKDISSKIKGQELLTFICNILKVEYKSTSQLNGIISRQDKRMSYIYTLSCLFANVFFNRFDV